MTDTPALPELPAATIAALRSRHIAYLADRLTSDTARGDFVRSFCAFHDYLLTRPIRELLDPARVIATIAAVATAPVVRDLARPIAGFVHARVVTSLATDDAKVGDYVPAEARAAIETLLAKNDVLPEALVRRVFEDEVTEDVMRDVLYDALVEFNDSVNPFFADWGLPGLLKRFMPIGSGAVIKSLGAVRTEFDKRLEPEIRKFLLVFARKSKGKIADFVVGKGGDPKFLALRKSIAAYVYEQTLAETTSRVDATTRSAVDDAVMHVVLEILRRDRPRERLHAELDAFLAAHGETTLGAWLGSIGATATPDLEAVAEALWPHVKLVLESPPSRAFYERITWDFYATLPVLAAEGDETG